MRHLLCSLRRYRKESILAPLFKMLEALFDLIVPLVMADIINHGTTTGDIRYILTRCGVLVLLAVIGTSCSLTAQYFAAKAAVGCSAALRRRLFASVQALDAAQAGSIGSNTLITRLTSDVNQVQNGVNMFLRLFLRSPFIVFGSLFLSFTISRRVGIIFTVIVAVLFCIVFGLMAWTTPLFKAVQTKLDTVLGVTRENLTGVRVVRAFDKQDAEVEHFSQANRELTRAQLWAGQISALLNPMTFLVIHLGVIAVLHTGAIQINVGTLQTGDVIALIDYLSQILVELVKMANTIVLISKASACMGRVSAVLDTPAGMSFPEQRVSPDQSAPAVTFDRVGLTYPGAGGKSLENLSFTVLQGQTIGVIGGTGSGKSSLVRLLARLYDATEGQIQLMGVPITAWSQKDLRRTVGIVPQNTQLFSGTIRSNLLWGRDDADDTALWDALKTAQAADFVRALPQGLDAPVEQGGRNFSGGQRQRLTLARALVGEPAILILDDSTSALDFATDAALRRALKTLPQETTIFLISQRTTSLQQADQILVLEDGQLVGCGTHNQLLESCPVYQEIHQSQYQGGGVHR